MDQSIYAYNKPLMDPSKQKLVDLDNSRTDGMQFMQPVGPQYQISTAGNPGQLWPSNQMGAHPPTIQSNQLHNGPLNGFQQDDINKPNPTLPLTNPSLNAPGHLVTNVNQPNPNFQNSGVAQQHPYSSVPTQHFPSQPPTMIQKIPSTHPSGYNPHPPNNFKQGPLENIASSQRSINNSPAGSLNASRSETPNDSRYGDQLRDQSLAGQSSQNNFAGAAPLRPSGLAAHQLPPPQHPAQQQQQQFQRPPQFQQQQQFQRPPQQLQQQQSFQGPPPPQQLQQQFQRPPQPLQQQQQQWPPQQQQQHSNQPPQPPFNLQQGYPQHQQHVPQPPPLLQSQPHQGFNPSWPSGNAPPNHPQQSSWQHHQSQYANQPQPSQNHFNNAYHSLPGSFDGLNLNQDHAMSKLCNLTQERELVPREGFVMNEPVLNSALKATNCSSEIMCCTLNAIPNTPSLLKKTRLPLGVLLHPFKDLGQLPLIQSGVIVRCTNCKTYINPFVIFLDPARWKCNICDKVNNVPTDFAYDRVTRSYGEPQKRPEVRSATLEYVAPAEYLVRPPMPAVYFYLLDVSCNAIETGYLELFCETLLAELDKIPGDGRTQIGFMAYDTSLYYFNLSEELSQPQMIVVPDLEEPYLPCPEGLLVNLQQSKQMVIELLRRLPSIFNGNKEVASVLGSALEFVVKIMVPIGGRISVFQTLLPTSGAGALTKREDSNTKIAKKINCLGPATDFYKKIALECSSDQVAIDLFLFNSLYCDVATIGGVSKYTGGCMFYFPNFHAATNRAENKRFKSALKRYLTRKIGFEAVMRIRFSKGLSAQNFHGNFFVRSTDLLTLPNVNPDAAYAVQLGLDEDLECNYVTFQAALLYTTSEAERRIRVHTLCVPVTPNQSDVFASANQLAILGLLSKMAAAKSLTNGLGDSREAMVNVAVDIIAASAALQSQKASNQLMTHQSLKLVPLLILALLKSTSFRIGSPTKVDDRIVAMEMCKNLPWKLLLKHIHPHLYPIHNLDAKILSSGSEEEAMTHPPMVSLSFTQMDRHGAYLMDAGSYFYLYLGPTISDLFCLNVLGVGSVGQVLEGELELPKLENKISEYLRTFVDQLNNERPIFSPIILIKEDGKLKHLFYQHLIEDKTESSFSYQEFLHHIMKEMKV